MADRQKLCHWCDHLQCDASNHFHYKENHITHHTWDGANRSLGGLVGTLDKQRVRVAAGLIDNLQQATVPKQAAGAGATFVEKGKRGNWSLHQGHRRGLEEGLPAVANNHL